MENPTEVYIEMHAERMMVQIDMMMRQMLNWDSNAPRQGSISEKYLSKVRSK